MDDPYKPTTEITAEDIPIEFTFSTLGWKRKFYIVFSIATVTLAVFGAVILPLIAGSQDLEGGSIWQILILLTVLAPAYLSYLFISKRNVAGCYVIAVISLLTLNLIPAGLYALAAGVSKRERAGTYDGKAGAGFTVAIAILAIMLIGILAAVALPAYQEYTIKAQEAAAQAKG